MVLSKHYRFFAVGLVLIFTMASIFLSLRSSDFNPHGFFKFGDSFFKVNLLRDLPHGQDLPVAADSHGYDGQFAYLLAIDPLGKKGYFKHMDSPAYRYQRWLLPVFSGILALGNDRWVPFTFILLNVLGICLLAYLSCTRNIAVLICPTLLISLLLNLNEVWALVFCYTAYLKMVERKYWSSSLLMVLAALIHETTLVWAFALFFSEWCLSKKIRWQFALPPAIYLLSALLIHSMTGAWPFLEGHGRFSAPFFAYVSTIHNLIYQLLNGGKPVFLGFSILAVAVLMLYIALGLLSIRNIRKITREEIQWIVCSAVFSLVGSAVLIYPASSLRGTYLVFLATALALGNLKHWPQRLVIGCNTVLLLLTAAWLLR